MSAEHVSRWSRRHVAVGALFLTAWQAVLVLGGPHRTGVVLGLYGFVVHTVVGKGYALVPTYFDRSLAAPRGPAVTLPLLTLGAVGLAAAPADAVPAVVGVVGAACWALGAAVFVGTLVASIGNNLSGRETATGPENADRQRVDRVANAFVPVVLGYLLVGAYETLAVTAGLPSLTGSVAGASHLLAAGVGALLIFAVGFRLLPRFLVSAPPRPLVAVVLPAGAVGPALVAGNLYGGTWFRAGAVVEAVAVIGFALSYVVLFGRSDRRRVGFYGPLAGVCLGVAGVALGVVFAFTVVPTGGPAAHSLLNLLGFLGLTVVGVAYQFYPPGVGSFPGATDRTALLSILCLAVGVVVAATAALAGVDVARTGGHLLGLVGAGLYSYLLLGLFRERYGNR
jgi:hypothetical protein